jgi:hypothetical protein
MQDAIPTPVLNSRPVGIVLFFATYGPSILLWLAFLLPAGWFLRRRWLRANAVVASSVRA